ncbi:MAG TPA: cell wall-binding repeat-containing protein [Acidimicrobiales bacterium]
MRRRLSTAERSGVSPRAAAAAVLGLTVLAVSAVAAGAVTYPPTPGVTYPPPTSTTATAAPAASYTVQTKANPQFGTILADGGGLTVYTLMNNGAPVACSGACATFWPPLVVPNGSQPTAGPGVAGLGTQMNANGDQVTENGIPLYRYSGDSGPSDAKGDGIVSFGGTWHVVKVAATACMPMASSPAPTGKVTRLAGADRDATSVAVSQATQPMAASAGGVVLASDAGFPDALAGTPLAVAKHGPLLLTTPTGLNPAVGSEIGRVLPKGGTVYLLGGSATLSSTIDTQIQAMGDVAQRVAGPDRFGTAVAVAGVLGNPHSILEATGLDFPDGLSAGAAAAKAGGAVLLTNGSAQASATSAYLAAHPGDTVTAVGGPAASADPAATPVAGADRFATAVAVAQHFFTSPTALGFASGLGFPDALSGGSGIGASAGPLLLVPSCGALPSSLSGYLGSVSGSVTRGILTGGTAVVGDDVLGELEQAA